MNFKTFINAEDGAVTVDWVVLTAGLVGLGLATMAVVSGGIENLSGDVSTSMTNIDPTAIYANFGAAVAAGWGDLAILSATQTAEESETFVASYVNSWGADTQTAYDQLYARASQDNPPADAIDDMGAFEAYAAENNITVDTGSNQSYAELHAAYVAANS